MQWIPEISHHLPGVPIVLVGLKADLRDDPRVVQRLGEKGQQVLSKEDGLSLAEKTKAAAYVECSAKSGAGILNTT